MPGKAFFDTSVLIYILKEGDPRSEIAAEFLTAGGVLSVQVLNEFANVARRKLGLTWEQIEEALVSIRDLCAPAAAVTVATHTAALKIAKRYGFQIYDSLILASALETDCSVLYSEDLQHGQKIDSLTVQNPFRSS
jgi:predicted nucleic acid-binding protein